MKKAWGLAICCFLLAACSKPAPVVLDENQAIQSTNAFLKEVLHKNYAVAYGQYMSPDLKFNPQTSLDQFSADWNAICEKYGDIQKATFDSYQMVPGKKVIQLYYRVAHAKASTEILYHLVTELNRKGEFKLFLVDIGNAQVYPANSKIQEPMLKKDQVFEIVP